VLAFVGAVVWMSQVVTTTPLVHSAAQFIHLTCVVVGLGSVVVVDWYGLRWQLGHTSLESVVATATMLSIPIWSGLTGLLLSGMFLQPDLSSPITQVKIGLVAAAGLVGVLASGLQRRLAARGSVRSPRLVRAGLILAVVSQLSWWGAAVIGFLNRT
jgi:hypothetical protein